jgi:predicted tellurium resistance membrane protein TerC
METGIILSFLTLTFLEVILGIDNVIFMLIAADKLQDKQRKSAINLGMATSVLIRGGLLFCISWIMGLNKTLLTINEFNLTGKDIVLFGGGLFLMYKTTTEIFSHTETGEVKKEAKKQASFLSVVLEMCFINIVFSFDSILTAVGLSGNLWVMICSIVVSSIIMLMFANYIGRFLEKHKSLKVLALSFIMMIGLFLILDSAHIEVPKGYIYAAITFSLFVETVNIKFRNRK